MRFALSGLLLLGCGFGCQFDGSVKQAARDAAADGNAPAPGDAGTMPPSDASTRADAAPSIEIRLNIAGAAHVGSDYPGAWLADPGAGGACGPLYYTNNSPVSGTIDDALFVNVAFGNPTVCDLGNGTLPSGNYRVRLYFAELFFGPGCPGNGGVGSRVFDIQLEGSLMQSDLDVFELAGCTENGGTPLVASFEIPISDGTLSIEMPASANNSMIAAIELVSLF